MESPPLTLACHVPYRGEESHGLACALALHAQEWGWDSQFFTAEPVIAPYEPRLDSRVRRINDEKAKKLYSSRRVMVWFDVQPAQLLAAKKAGCRNVLVTLWHRLEAADHKYLNQYDVVVCPHPDAAKWLSPSLAKPPETISWDSALGFQPARPSLLPDERRLVILLDGRGLKEHGCLLLHTVRVLLDRLPLLKLRLLVTRGWNGAADAMATELIKDFGPRAEVRRRGTRLAIAASLTWADWVFCPGFYDSSGWAILSALSCHTPVIGFDSSPANYFIDEGYNGWLLPVEQQSGRRPPVLQPNSRDLSEGLFRVLTDEAGWATRQQQEWTELPMRLARFEKSWRAILDSLLV